MINIDIQELKRLYYDEQQSAYEIAQHFKANPSTIYGRMKKHGLQRRSASNGQKARHAKTRITLNTDEIVRLYFDERLTLTEVGKRVGTSSDTVQKRLWASGYKCRARHPRISKTKGTSMFTASRFYRDPTALLRRRNII